MILKNVRTLLVRNLSTQLPLQTITETKIISQNDVDEFAKITGDHNPIHKSDYPAADRLVHGALLNGIVSGLVGTRLPGAGSIIVAQEFQFPNKCFVDQPIIVKVDLLENRKILKIAYECMQSGNVVFKGTGKLVMAK